MLRRAQPLPYHFDVAMQHDYSLIQRTLAGSHALADASEAHGTLTGALCAMVPYRLEDWLAEILPEGVASLEDEPALQTLYESTVAALSDRQMEFDLLIPTDDHPIEERTQALTAWCSGFLYGLGSVGAADPQRLSGELVRDLTEITRADVDRSDTPEANESALAELVEFVRVGVQLVFDELEPLRERHTAARPVLH